MIEVSFQTSGTTGKPKKIVHSFPHMVENAKAFNKLVNMRSDVVMYHCMPRDHMAGFLNTILCPTLAGGKVVFGPVFSPTSALSFWEQPVLSKCNMMWITPTMASGLIRLVRDKDVAKRNAGGFDQIFCGTAPLSQKLRYSWMDAFGIPLQGSYGTSEHMLISSQTKADAWNGDMSYGGIVDGITLAFGEEDEILVSKDNGREYSVTGDTGRLVGGNLHVTGRLKDIIIKGGENVSPGLIEDTIREIPGIVDAAAVGKPHEFWGETVTVFIEGSLSDDILSRCRKALPISHCPDEIIVVDELPRTATGKVRKEVLRQRFVNICM